jgi:membrane protein implicated in regulation of membrane protease activity
MVFERYLKTGVQERWYRGSMDDPDIWRWVWLLAAGGFAAAEMFTAGTFFILPFAGGALAASIAGFGGGGVGLQWVVFILVTIAGAITLIPLRRRLDATEPSDGIGARRLIGQSAVVLSDISSGPTGSGDVQVGRESWRAESADGSALPAGTTVRVVDVRGTSVVVIPVPPVVATEGDQ